MLKQIKDVVRKCGGIIKDAHINHIESKNDDMRNLVTEYDGKIEKILKQELLDIVPEAGFLGEEQEKNFKDKGYCFICDPIDGTTNFIKGLKHSAVSVALLYDGQPIIGVIYDPYLDEMFWAEKGKGAFLNKNAIHTTNVPLQNSLIVFGTSPYNKSLHGKTWNLAEKSFNMALDVRRNGAAVLDLTGVAMGRFGVYWELETLPWDYAAGSLIVTEAGGEIRNFNNQKFENYFQSSSIIAAASQEHLDYFIRKIS